MTGEYTDHRVGGYLLIGCGVI